MVAARTRRQRTCVSVTITIGVFCRKFQVVLNRVGRRVDRHQRPPALDSITDRGWRASPCVRPAV
jgi:hypothetical protein